MPGSEMFEGWEGSRLFFALPKVASTSQGPDPKSAGLGSFGTGKSILFAHLATTALLMPPTHCLPRESLLFALTAWDRGKTAWDLPPSGATYSSCNSCNGGGNLEAFLADFRRSRCFLPQRRNPSLTTRHDLLGEREPLSPFDTVPRVNGLFENDLPSFSSPAARPCTLPPLRISRKVHPGHQEMLIQILKRIIWIIRLVRKLISMYLRRLSHVPMFGLLMMAAVLRYGHRHDSDDDLRFPLRRYMITAGGATTV